MNFIYICTQDYIEPSLVSIASIVTKHSGDNFYICLPVGEYIKLNEDNINKAQKVSGSIKFIEINEFVNEHSEFIDFDKSFINQYSFIPLYKNYLPEILDTIGISEGVYMDCDTVMYRWDDEIGNILKQGLGLSSYDVYKKQGYKRPRVNPGVVYINLNLINREDWKKVRNYIFNNWLKNETDHLDTEFYSKFYFDSKYTLIPSKYNTSLNEFKDDCVIIHFVSVVPWNCPNYPLRDVWMSEYNKYIELINAE